MSCPQCNGSLESRFQQPLDPLRNIEVLQTSTPDYMFTRPRPEGIGIPRIIYYPNQYGRSRVNVPARIPNLPVNENNVVNVAPAADTAIPEDIVDYDINEANNEDFPEENNAIPAEELFMENTMPSENYDEINPDYMNGGNTAYQHNEIFDDMDAADDLYPVNTTAEPERVGLLQRIFNRNRNNNTDTIRGRNTGRGSRILNILLRIARLTVPLIMLILLVASVITNWASIKSIFLLFATAWILSFGGLILLSHNHLNHNAIFALSTAIGVIAVVVTHCAVLSYSLVSTLSSLLVPIFMVWMLMTLIRGVLSPRR